jgi:CheY-like chemotaxis protein
MSSLPDVPEPTTTLRAVRRVLVVDDDRYLREWIGGLLEGAGYRVSEACDGQQALMKVLVHWPDLIALGRTMPITGGWQFLKVRSEHPLLARTPVIFVPAFGQPGGRGRPS